MSRSARSNSSRTRRQAQHSKKSPPGIRLRIASASSLIVFKAFADRPQDWIDIESVIVRSGSRIDWQWVETQLRTLLELKGEPAALERLASLRKKLARS
ncbi:MAG: hypothetical protein ACT4P4_16410 [Betaproteobacteria bacterium]